jgi:RecB family exonuclease
MNVKSLSATAVHVYETCPARFKTTYIERARELSGAAANLGTACHAALEQLVKSGDYQLPEAPRRKALMSHYDTAYWLLFSDKEHYAAGHTMLDGWHARTDLLDGRTILSTEQKANFNLKTSAGDIPFNFIWDRCDQLPNGEIEVVDYKTSVIPVQPEDLKKKIQSRAYALAAAIKYPTAPAIWVSFDMLRYDLVGTRFTREDNIETWNYLKGVAERILADEGLKEILNPECRFCLRSPVCETLLGHAKAGGTLSITDLADAADKRAKLDYARSAIETQIKDLDAFILAQAEANEITEFKTDNTQVKINSIGRRAIDSERAGRIIGPELMTKYGTLNIGAVDDLMKRESLEQDVRQELRSLIRKKFTSPSVKTSPLVAIGDDD